MKFNVPAAFPNVEGVEWRKDCEFGVWNDFYSWEPAGIG
jgi:hypothetical protein